MMHARKKIHRIDVTDILIDDPNFGTFIKLIFKIKAPVSELKGFFVEFKDRIDRMWNRFFLNLLRRPEKSEIFFFFFFYSRRSEIDDRCWTREVRTDANVELFLFLFIYCVKCTFLLFLNTNKSSIKC